MYMFIGKSAGSCASMAADFKDLNISGYHGPLHVDLKGRATGPFRQTSGDEGVLPAQGRGHKTSLYKA